MKTSSGFSLRKPICFASGLAIMMLGRSAAIANTYQWNGSTSTNWTTAANWSTGTGLTAGPAVTNVSSNHRLNVSNSPNFECVYTASQGTTVYGSNNIPNPIASTGVRGLVIGSTVPGSFRIVGGSFSSANQSNPTNNPDILGNGNNAITANFNIDGGTYTSAASGITIGNTSGFITGNLNLNGGTANITTLSMDGGNSTVNLNSNSTLNVNLITNATMGAAAPVGGYNRVFNFNGGKLVPGSNSTGFMACVLARASVRNGGAIIDTSGRNITIAQPLLHSTNAADSATDGGLTKNGAGTLTLSVAKTNSFYTNTTLVNTYTGPTVVNQGSLVLGSSPANSSSLVLAGGTSLSLGVSNSVWNVASASLTNSSMTLNYGSWLINSYTGAIINATNLAVSGAVTINISGVGFPVTNLTLLTYGSKTGGGNFTLGTLPAGAVATLVDNGSSVVLQITTPSLQSLTWSGGDNIWQVSGGLDWNSGTATYLEYPTGSGDVVTFDDNFGGGTVTISGVVKPAGITVNDTSSFYTFGGSGSIAGATGIAKSGTSTLQINTSNSFTGAVTISGGSGTSGGTLFVNNAFALGATNGGVTVSGPANTLEIGTPGGAGVGVANKTVTINGTGVGGAKGALRGAATSSGNNIWAGSVVIGADLSRIGTEDSGNLTVTGPITDNGSGYTLLLRPGSGGILTMASSGGSYLATRTFGDATTTISLGADNGILTNALQMGPGNMDLNGFNQSFTGIADTSVTLGTILNNTGASTLTINGASSSASSVNIQDGSGTISVFKTGSGTQTLSGSTVTYSGATTINQGQLNLSSVNPLATAITVAGGATLGGKATTTGSLTFNSNSTLSVNPSTAGSFTANSVDASASPININFTSAPTNNQDVLVLSASGGITGLAVNFQAYGLRGGVFYLTNSNTELHYSATGVPATLAWKGNSSSNPTFWDVGTTPNWNNAGSPDKFFTSDSVVFDDTASSFSVAVQGASVLPGSVSFSNSVNAYTLGGGSIAGAISLTKSGAAPVTMNVANSYSGGTLVTNGGVLIVNNTGALGGGSATISSNSVLQLNSSSSASSGSSTTFATALNGNGRVKVYMTAASQPDTILANMGAFAGVVELTNNGSSGDRLNIGGVTAPSATVQVDSGNTLFVSTTATLSNVLVSGVGNFGNFGAIRFGNAGAGQVGTLNGAITLTSDATLGFNANNGFVSGNISSTATASNTYTLTVGTLASSSSGAFGGVLNDGIYGGKLALSQTKSTLTLSNNNTYSGATSISGASTLKLTATGSISNTASINLNDGTFDPSSAGTFTLSGSQSLGGSGTVLGDVVANGLISPGTANIGTLVFSNNLTINANLFFKLKKGSAPSNDVIRVTGTLTQTGTGSLTVTNAGTSLAVGDKFTLFNQAVTGGNALTIAGPAGITFTNNLANDGSISVLSIAPQVPPTLIVTNLGGSLQFSWSGGGTLQAQTNSLNIGIGTNWVDYPGSSPVTVPINSANGCVFFRVKQ